MRDAEGQSQPRWLAAYDEGRVDAGVKVKSGSRGCLARGAPLR